MRVSMDRKAGLASAFGLSIAMSFNAYSADNDEFTVNFNQNRVEFNCLKDFPQGQPTMQALDKIDRAFHGGREGTISFLMLSDVERQNKLKETFGYANVILKHVSQKYKTVDDPLRFSVKLLEQNHPILSGSKFFSKIEKKRSMP